MKSSILKAVQTLLVFVLLFAMVIRPAHSQDGSWRSLVRQSDKQVEHVIIFVSGWQLADPCVLAGVVPDVGLDLCESRFNPIWTWQDFKAHFLVPNAQEMLYNHNLSFPSYPGNAVGFDPSRGSKIVYYSYTGNYSYIYDASDSDDIEPVAKGSCQPHEQLNAPREIDGQAGYQCLPDYTRADTSILISRVDNKTFWEALNDNLVAAFTDFDTLEEFAKILVEKIWENPLNPNPAEIAVAESEFIAQVAGEAIDKTLTDFGLFEPTDIAPQRALFNLRAQHLQELIDSIIDQHQDKQVEFTIVGHSQGGLITTYWAGWQGSPQVQKDASHVNAIVTLDSPLGRTISSYGLANTLLKDVKNFQLVVDIPPVSVPVLGQVFPGKQIHLDIPIGDMIRARLSQYKLKLFWGMDDVVENATSQVPVYTIRNHKDLFVTADYARLDNSWHDKVVDFDGERLSANHGQVTKHRSISRDLQYVAVSGSVYSPNGQAPAILYSGNTRSQPVQILLASPPFLHSGVRPSRDDFQVQAVASDTRIAYALDVIGSVSQAPVVLGESPEEVAAPPLSLTVIFPNDIPEGVYDLEVSFDSFVLDSFAPPSVSVAKEAIQVVGTSDFSDVSLVVVIDRSGSMNDPLLSGGRKIDAVKNAATFLTQLSSTTTQNRLGILAFSSSSQRIYPAGALQEVTTNSLNAYLAAVSGLTAGGGTELTEALVNAHQWFDESGTTHRTKAIIALTDGASFDTWSSNFTDVPVYTIGFGQESGEFDEEELKRIAQETGGAYYYAPNEVELRAIYDTIQRQVSGANGIVQLEESLTPSVPQTIPFVVDPTIQQFRLAINWDPSVASDVDVSLVTPSGDIVNEDNFPIVLPNSRIFSDTGSWVFSTIAPQAGVWKLVVTGAQVSSTQGLVRITSAASTPIQLQLALPTTEVPVGQPLRTFLNLANLDDSWTVINPVNVEATVVLPSGERVPIDLFDDGFHGDGAADDLVFAAIVPSQFVRQAGSYIIDVAINGLLGQRDNGEVFAAQDGEELPFERSFSTVLQVVDEPADSTTADLASMVVQKPGSATEYCISYANEGPGTATNVSLLVAADNALYGSSSIPAQRNVSGFSFGWNLGSIAPGTVGLIDTSVVQLRDDEAILLASTISDEAETDSIAIDPTGQNTISVEDSQASVQQLATGWTLLGLGQQPTVASPAAVLCAMDGDVNVVLGFDKVGLTYDPAVPAHINTLSEMDALRGYWIRTDEPRSFVVNGVDVPVDTPIELHSGWNLINYLPTTVQSVDDALSFIDGEYTAVLGYEQGATSFYSNVPPQLNTLQKLEPGKAYWIHMKRARTLIYHEQPETPASAAAVTLHNSPQRPAGVTLSNQWVNFFSQSVTVDGQPAPVGTRVEAFTSGGIKVGEARIVESGMMELLAAYADDQYTEQVDGAKAGEALHFVVNGREALVLSGETPRWTSHGALSEVRLHVGAFDNNIFLPNVNR